MHTSLILLLAAAGSILGLASAEAPINVCCMAYTTVNNTLYVQGGAGPLIIHNSQFFSLDLTLSGWNTSSPHWKVLPVGAGAHSAPFEHYHTMTATKDKKDLVVWGSRTGISTYNFATTTWTNDTAYDPISLLGAGKDPMGLDPITGLIYIPTVANNGTGMRIYNSDTRTSSIVPMYPSTILPYQAKAFTFVWSELRKSFLFFGGFGLVNDIPQYNDSMIEYQPSTYSWTRVPTSGRPGLLASHCMIPAYGGTKMVVFGGWQGLRSVASQTPSYSSALYMLDVNEMKWTLISEGAVVGRRDMACAVVGDNFVAWGGIDNNDQVAGTLIYNLKSNQWTDTYIAASAESPPPSSSSTSKLGIYIGVGIAAGVLLGGVMQEEEED
ncbi:hypothetical protein BGW39_007796 [Mortierella sp. 14UC]|nr:hypothetical protein BGW39_007796 [Mortierella sp. 14UC]